MATEGARERVGTPGGFRVLSQPPAPARASLQVLLPEVAPNWEEGNKTGVKAGLGRQRGASHPPVPRFGRLQSIPAHKGAAFALWPCGSKPAAGGHRQRTESSAMRGAPRPGDAQHHPELSPPPIPMGSALPCRGMQQEPRPPAPRHGRQPIVGVPMCPIVGVPMCPQGWDRDHAGAQHHPQGLRAGKPPRGDEVGSGMFPPAPSFGSSELPSRTAAVPRKPAPKWNTYNGG